MNRRMLTGSVNIVTQPIDDLVTTRPTGDIMMLSLPKMKGLLQKSVRNGSEQKVNVRFLKVLAGNISGTRNLSHRSPAGPRSHFEHGVVHPPSYICETRHPVDKGWSDRKRNGSARRRYHGKERHIPRPCNFRLLDHTIPTHSKNEKGNAPGDLLSSMKLTVGECLEYAF